ncbi:MAG: hypothetical protein ACK55S_08390 [Planctomycetota bacterium]
MSRSRRHRRDDFGGEESWFSRQRRRAMRYLESLFDGERSLDRSARSEPLWYSGLMLLPRALGELFHFLINDWSTSRKGRAFFFALPALGTVALIAAILSVAAWKLETTRDGFYSARLAFYQQQKDFEFAKSCALKLVELSPSAENKYKLALAKRQVDDFAGAFDLMTALAPEEKVSRAEREREEATLELAGRAESASKAKREAAGKKDIDAEQPGDAGQKGDAELGKRGEEPGKASETAAAAGAESAAPDSVAEYEQELVFTGYAPAHLWLADLAAFGTDWTLSNEERKRVALLHYSAAYELSSEENTPESIYASLRLSELQVQAGELAQAERTLRSAANKPVLTLLHLQAIAKLFSVLKQQDKTSEIEANATGLQPRLFRLASEIPDAIEPWQALVDVASQAENYQEADDYIQSALAMAKEPNTRRGLLQLRAAVLMRRAMQMRDVEREDRYLEKFGYLATAIAVDPTNDKLYVSMLEYADLNEQIPQEDDFLRLALGSGKNPGVVHVILGIRDAQRNERTSAFNHWEIADTQTDRAEWLVGMFARFLLQAKTLDSSEYMQFLDLCEGHYAEQPMLRLARAEASLLLRQDAETAVPLLEKLIAENDNFLAAREAYITALKALGRTEDAEKETLKLKEMAAELQKRQGQAAVGKQDESGAQPR